ncbi:MAG: DUF3570 domain-containing protein [Minicystis sp.]
MKIAGALAALFVGMIAGNAIADEAPEATKPAFSDADILGKPPPYFRIESVSLRYTHIEQTGTGFQSRRGPAGGPGDEALRVEQPQLEVIAKQGDRITHRVWIPVDIVTAASPDGIDVVSTASRTNEAGSVDWTTTYKWSPETSLAARTGLHNEENWRSWNVGFGFTRSFAEDNTVLEGSVNQIADWFDKYTLAGKHDGHTARSSLNASLGLTQILSPTTIGHIDYGITLQRGQLSNGWNAVPLTDGNWALEVLPKGRVRHAIVGRVAQWLPWNGAAHGFYRFYVDDWGIRAHTMEFELYQRFSPSLYARVNYRFHTQTAASFFHTRVAPGFTIATADSDLASLDAQTVGFKIAAEIPVRFAKTLRLDLAAERYFRSNDLRASVVSCGLGLLF